MTDLASAHIYVHIPFCRSKCGYCDFNSYSGLSQLIPDYVAALVEEMAFRAPAEPVKIETVYFGGGTPSLLEPEDVGCVLEACRREFGMAPHAEVTLEANPGTISPGLLAQLREAGVNRLSLGVQSFDDRALKLLGRIHSGEKARGAFLMTRQAGFANVNLDLMYGLPRQTLPTWESDLARALELQPEHLSLYCLTIEDDTRLGRSVAKGDVPFPDPDLAADMYLLAEDRLEAAGYEHYEISNWARPGMACRHNLSCWRNEPYLGFGAGAHSCASGFRFSNVMRPEEYIARLRAPAASGDYAGLGPAVDKAEAIDRDLEMAETMILGLRLTAGVSLGAFAERYGVDAVKMYDAHVTELTRLGLLERASRSLRLTRRGRLLGNEVFSRFLAG
ncbi:MAG: radical SAM family heme chaperone HemW [Chloroflexi bacterium]|nr:radical SAM family heme chaperone HemW [Chloroflexota bacterium]